jgi:hypothetical protein
VAIWKEKGVLKVPNSSIKHAPEVRNLLEAIKPPIPAVIVHCRVHQNTMDQVSLDNKMYI